MRSILLFFCITLCLSSCKSAKTKSYNSQSKKIPVSERSSSNPIAKDVISEAKKFRGVKYKYGGSSKKGMDCSGLIYTAFNANNIPIERTTSSLSKSGKWIDLKKVQSGDLLFFATKKNSRKVNHVGLVTSVNNGDLEFIHASTSKGVIISKLSQTYWYFAFVQARRIL